MKKQLRFLYRYLIAAGHWRSWINMQTLLIVVVSGIFLAVLLISTPRSNDSPPVRSEAGGPGTAVQALHIQQTETPAEGMPPADGVPSEPVQPTPTRTPFPPEFYENADQTAGISLAGVALVLIIFAGAWMVRPSRRQD